MQQSARPLDASRPPKFSNDFGMSNPVAVTSKPPQESSSIKFDVGGSRVPNSGVKHRTPAIVRPFETTSTPVFSSAPSTFISTSNTTSSSGFDSSEKSVDLPSFSNSERRSHSGGNSVISTNDAHSNSKPFSVWQPVQLNSPTSDVESSISNSSNSIGSKTQSQQIHTDATSLVISSIPVSFSEVTSLSSGKVVGESTTTVISSLSSSLPSVISQAPYGTKSIQSSQALNASTLSLQFPHFPSFFSQNLHLPYSSSITQTTQSLLQPTQPESSKTDSYHHPLVTVSVSSPVTQIQTSNTHSENFIPQISNVSQHSFSTCDFPALVQAKTLSQPSPLPLSSVSPVLSQNSIRNSSLANDRHCHSTLEVSSANTNLSSSLTLPIVSVSNIQVKEEKIDKIEETLINDNIPQVMEEVTSPVSRLDTEEQRLRELKATGMLDAEAEETLFLESLTSTKTPGVLCMKGPPNPFEASREVSKIKIRENNLLSIKPCFRLKLITLH